MLVLQHGVGSAETLHNMFGHKTKEWAESHGCHYVFSNQRACPERTAYWEKPLIINQTMNLGVHDEILWADSDTFVVSPEVSPIGVLKPWADLAICCDTKMPFNSGLFFIRNNRRTRNYMQDVYEKGDLPAAHYDQPRMIERLQHHEIAVQILPWEWNAAKCTDMYDTGYGNRKRIIAGFHGWPHEARVWAMERLMSNRTKLGA